LLVSRYRDLGDAEADEFVSSIVDGVERMSVLIHDLLEYSRTGVQESLPSEPASAEVALGEVLFSLSVAIQESGAAITHDPLPEVWLESRSLVQLLQGSPRNITAASSAFSNACMGKKFRAPVSASRSASASWSGMAEKSGWIRTWAPAPCSISP
jgi:light-regulated signal transduction histidine kinase (bacteriophytochrome)